MILLAPTTLAAAVTAQVTTPNVQGHHNFEYLACYAVFVRAAGGTTAKFWIQTTFDGGGTWCDIMNFAFATTSVNKVSVVTGYPATPFTANTTPTDGSLADNTVLDGLLGTQYRVKYTTTGTYSGASSIAIYGVGKPFHV